MMVKKHEFTGLTSTWADCTHRSGEETTALAPQQSNKSALRNHSLTWGRSGRRRVSCNGSLADARSLIPHPFHPCALLSQDQANDACTLKREADRKS